MNRQHTPGPWRYEKATQTIRSVPTNYWLATTDSWDGAIAKQNDANARLMAAAPDLLDALQGLVTDKYLADPINADRMKNARAAIAKATGGA